MTKYDLNPKLELRGGIAWVEDVPAVPNVPLCPLDSTTPPPPLPPSLLLFLIVVIIIKKEIKEQFLIAKTTCTKLWLKGMANYFHHI